MTEPAAKSFLVQKFAKIPLEAVHVLGYSVAGEETVVQIPELGVCFDIGRCPHFALTSDIVCLSHGHMDHIAGLAYYLSQRFWRDVERQGTPYKLIGLAPNQTHEVRRDFHIRALATHHGGPSLGYSLIS